MIKEKFLKNSDWNKTRLEREIDKITDDNFNFKDNYEITWEIKKI